MISIKHISILILILTMAFQAHAQNMSVNSDGSRPDSSAMLDVSSTTKGMLIPRMTSAQRVSIANPAQGLIIFQTDGNSGLWVFDTNSIGWGFLPTTVNSGLDSTLARGNDAGNQSIVNIQRLGIGIATPTADLQILDTAASIVVQSTNSLSWASVRLETPGSNFSMISSNSVNFPNGFFIRDNNIGINRLAIDSIGNIGLGTLEPKSKLHVIGDILLTAADTSRIFNSDVAGRQILSLRGKRTMTDGAGINIYGNNDALFPGTIRLMTGGNFDAALWIDTAENVAIGNQIPTEKLDVAGNVKADSLVIYDGANAPAVGDVLTAIDATGRTYWSSPVGDGNGIYSGSGALSGNTTVTFGANQLNFATGATQGFNVDGTTFSVDGFNNRVGIGNINPTSTLDVNGGIRSGAPGTDGQLTLYSEQGATDYQVIFNPSATMTQTTTYTLPANDGNANDMLISDGLGNMSWASTTALGNGIYSGSGALSGATIVSQGANTLAFTSTAVNGFSIDGNTFSVNALNNRVGIGTAAPNSNLHVLSAGVSELLVESSGLSDARLTLTNSTNTWDVRNFAGELRVVNNGIDQFTIETSGNVGIGSINPSSKLEVVGDVEIPSANNYTYSTAKTNYVSLSPNAFTSLSTTATLTGPATGNSRYFLTGSTGALDYLYADVQLPHGAVVTEVAANVLDSDVTYDVDVDFVRKNLGGSTIIGVLATTASTTGSGGAQSISTAPLSITIDNSSFAYYLTFNTRQNTSNLRIMGVRITYTVTQAD